MLSVAVLIGSVWFHAAPGDAATWTHNVTLYSLAVVGAIEAGRQIVGRRPPILAAVVFGAGLIIWFFSRTGGALCDPDSAIQGHAIWHVAAALGVGVLFGTPRSGRQQTATMSVGLSQK